LVNARHHGAYLHHQHGDTTHQKNHLETLSALVGGQPTTQLPTTRLLIDEQRSQEVQSGHKE